MRNLICAVLICSFLLLAGCVTAYDSFEYRGFVKIAAMADKKDCSQDHVNNMLEESRFLYRYSLHKQNEDSIIQAARELLQSIEELNMRLHETNISPHYCTLKMTGISIIAGTYAETVGKKF